MIQETDSAHSRLPPALAPPSTGAGLLSLAVSIYSLVLSPSLEITDIP